MLRMLMSRGGDDDDVEDDYVEEAEKDDVENDYVEERTRTDPKTGDQLCASLRNRNAQQHITRATSYGNADTEPLCVEVYKKSV